MAEKLRITGEMFFNSLFAILHSSSAVPLFSAYNAQHVVTLGIIAMLGAIIAWLGKKGAPSAHVWLGRSMVLLLAGYAAVFYGQQFFAQSLSWEYSLPLELCSLALIACLVSLLWKSQFAAEIAYFWGLGGGLHAIATPDIPWGFPSWSFILFFWGHGITVLTVIFLIAGQNFRPRRGSILRMMAALNLYALTVGAIDAAAGWNYGYLCAKPSAPSLLDFLGPWPWYLLSIELIALLTFLLLDLPWRLLPKGGQATQSPNSRWGA